MMEGHSADQKIRESFQDSIGRIDAAMALSDFSTARTLASSICDRDGQGVPIDEVAQATLRLAG